MIQSSFFRRYFLIVSFLFLSFYYNVSLFHLFLSSSFMIHLLAFSSLISFLPICLPTYLPSLLPLFPHFLSPLNFIMEKFIHKSRENGIMALTSSSFSFYSCQSFANLQPLSLSSGLFPLIYTMSFSLSSLVCKYLSINIFYFLDPIHQNDYTRIR